MFAFGLHDVDAVDNYTQLTRVAHPFVGSWRWNLQALTMSLIELLEYS